MESTSRHSGRVKRRAVKRNRGPKTRHSTLVLDANGPILVPFHLLIEENYWGIESAIVNTEQSEMSDGGCILDNNTLRLEFITSGRENPRITAALHTYSTHCEASMPPTLPFLLVGARKSLQLRGTMSDASSRVPSNFSRCFQAAKPQAFHRVSRNRLYFSLKTSRCPSRHPRFPSKVPRGKCNRGGVARRAKYKVLRPSFLPDNVTRVYSKGGTHVREVAPPPLSQPRNPNLHSGCFRKTDAGLSRLKDDCSNSDGVASSAAKTPTPAPSPRD